MGGHVRDRNTGEYIDRYGEFDVEVRHTEAGHYPASLQAEARLPGIAPGGPEYWPVPVTGASATEATAVAGIFEAVRNLLRPAKAV